MINAMWLEGSDSQDTVDQFSDLDIVLDVEDGYELEVFKQIENILSSLSPVDLNYEKENYHPKLKTKFFHLKGTPESLFLDITIQSHSRNFKFVKENDSEIPIVIFDRKGIIQFKSLNHEEYNSELLNRLYHLENTINQKARAEKYISRNNLIEAIGYYQKFVMAPLIELLRIKYKPINYDYYIVSISKHLPKEMLRKIEELYVVSSLDELNQKIQISYDLFYSILPEVKNELQASIKER